MSEHNSQQQQSNSQGTPEVVFNVSDTFNRIPETMDDSDLMGGVQQEQFQDINVNPAVEQETQIPAGQNNPSAEEEPNNDSVTKPTGTEEDTDTEGSEYDGYSQPALFATALRESGLNIFPEEVNKELGVSDFISNFKSFSQQYAEQVAQQKLAELGEAAEYVQMYMRTGTLENIAPAIQAENIANFDLESPDLTEASLIPVVKAMYEKQVTNPDLIPALIEADKLKGIEHLKERAGTSVKFH